MVRTGKGMNVATANLRHSAGLSDGDASVYYDCLEPASGATRPTIVMIHGGAHTGDCYLRTADGRRAGPIFAARGRRVVVLRIARLGAGGFVAADRLTGETIVQGLGTLVASLAPPVFLMTHSMGAFARVSSSFTPRAWQSHRRRPRAAGKHPASARSARQEQLRGATSRPGHDAFAATSARHRSQSVLSSNKSSSARASSSRGT